MAPWLSGTTFGAILTTFFMSAVPIIELRGGIPWGVAHDLPPLISYTAAVLGNMLPIPFILLFLRHVFNWLRNFEKTKRLVEGLERRAHLKGRKVEKYKSLGLVLLVAIPLPGTGAWTGALVASVLDIPLRKSLLLIFIGVCSAGIFMLTLSHSIKLAF